jgi:hypothetical protein
VDGIQAFTLKRQAVAQQVWRISYAQLKRYGVRLKQLFYMRLMLMVVTGFTVVNIAATVLGGYVEGRPLFNPFAAWVDALLGQPRSVIDARAFSCPISTYNYYVTLTEDHCYLTLTGGAIAQVSVYISHGFVRHVYFKLRDNTLKVRDLLILWGRSANQNQEKRLLVARFVWPGSGIEVEALTVAYTGQFSPLVPIQWVYFKDTSWQE